ncbi:MAG: acyl carrier protein [Wujia sp.]|nr:acyl carrier protein [Wujia sp.]MCI6240335.1 acyl carrier protein [Clostridium sp.]MDD7282582.1 acyl carrier protein [Clostridium sp.]MDY3728631.1 acyl carrier protein [Wujia sp.]
MEKEQIVKKLEEVIHDVMPEVDTIDMNVNMVETYGVNSVSLIRLIVAAESKFDISFTDYELALTDYDTFGDLAATIAEKLA